LQIDRQAENHRVDLGQGDQLFRSVDHRWNSSEAGVGLGLRASTVCAGDHLDPLLQSLERRQVQLVRGDAGPDQTQAQFSSHCRIYIEVPGDAR
jgi:hypothetical protein